MDLIEMNIRESSSLPCSVILKNADKISGPYLVFTDTTTSLVSKFVIDSRNLSNIPTSGKDLLPKMDYFYVLLVWAQVERLMVFHFFHNEKEIYDRKV